MLIEFDKIDETVIENFLGGDGSFSAKMHIDNHGKIIHGRLTPGSSIGMHTHNGSGEIIYILSGNGKVLYDTGEEALSEGSCHYCPEGHAHSLVNNSDGDLVFFAVVPLYGTSA